MSAGGPERFGWLISETLAGSGRPGRYHALSDDLAFLTREGISVIVSLLETTVNLVEYRAAGFDARHLPVEDFAPPSAEQIQDACTTIEGDLARGARVLVHCNAGIGRTGTLLACFLVHQGETAERSIRRVRAARPLSLETREQEDAVRKYFAERSARSQ